MKSFLLMMGWLLAAQVAAGQTIRGTVCDDRTKEPLVGTSVLQHDTRNGTATDVHGAFRLDLLPNQSQMLVFRFLGYETLTVDVRGRDHTQPLEVCLAASPFRGEEVVVQGVRVDERAAVTFSNMSKEEIERENNGREVPFLLQQLPSVVTSSDAGAGIGYASMQIRGVDQARINVTVNGIPLNDSESHGVFWVNMPDFAGSVESVQVQRGVGTSTNGAAAFGASVNIQTDAASREAHGSVTTAIGSFNTKRVSLETGTGLLGNHWTFDGRLSATTSDGYVDRAFSDLNSWFVSGARSGDRSLLKVNAFSGKQRTYQAWYGVPESELKTNRRMNEYTYENQVDSYRQTHLQLHYSVLAADAVTLHAALHYTKGAGFFEEYRNDDKLANYGIGPVVIENAVISQADLIRRRWLDNHFYGAVASADVQVANRFNVTFGGAYNVYDGDHFGEVIWSRFAGNSEIGDRYYDNNALKKDASGYVKVLYRIGEKLDVYGDVQLRGISYDFQGLDEAGTLDQSVNYLFFNPKAGLSMELNAANRVYAGFGVAQKEPTRKEHTESSRNSRPKPERLNNLELGWRYGAGNVSAGVGGYWMDYHNQLIPTGQINDVGEYTRMNVKDSYRIGLEFDAAWKPAKTWALNANLTLSRSRIPEFTEYVDAMIGEEYTDQAVFHLKDTPIALSPEVVAGAGVRWMPVSGAAINLHTRHVGRQFLDNSGAVSRSLNPYTFADLGIEYGVRVPGVADLLQLQLTVYNITDALYESNGYTWGWIQDGERIAYNYYFPQAGRHVMLQAKVRF